MVFFKLKTLKREMVRNNQLAVKIDFEYDSVAFDVVFFIKLGIDGRGFFEGFNVF